MQTFSSHNTLPVSPAIYYPTLECKARRVVHQGGQWSGKTVNILAVLATRAASEKNKVITVVAASLPHLKRGALRDFENYIYPYFKKLIANHNKTDNTFVFKTGSIIEFKSFETEFDARGAKRDYLYLNEANSIDYMIFYQLDSRTTTQSIIDYNPTAPFWAHEKLIGTEGCVRFISDHRHNPFLSPEKHREIESEKDPELFRVYARGLTGNIQGVIYPNWTRIPEADMPTDDEFIGGIDFGYTIDPTAAVKVWVKGDNIYVRELVYEAGFDETKMKEIFDHHGFTGSTPIYCDHDNLTIAKMRRIGLHNSRIALKPILQGILKLKQYNVFYSERSYNLADEVRKYVWMTDPSTGNPLNKPIDKYNHLLDAIRYAVYTHYF